MAKLISCLMLFAVLVAAVSCDQDACIAKECGSEEIACEKDS